VMASNVDELKMPFEPMKMSLCEIWQPGIHLTWVMLEILTWIRSKESPSEINLTNGSEKLNFELKPWPEVIKLKIRPRLTSEVMVAGWAIEMPIEQTDLMGDIYLVFKAEQFRFKYLPIE
jgi:hypothetical protein